MQLKKLSDPEKLLEPRDIALELVAQQ